MIEVWKDITGFEGLYKVSSLGRVKSLQRTARQKNTMRIVPEIILAIAIQSQGYPVVTLSKADVQLKRRVSRLVAIEFVANPNSLPEVNHEDGNKLNCAASNLTWTNRSGNMKHAYRTGLKKKPAGYTHALRLKNSHL